MNYLISLATALTLFSTQTIAWTISADFENPSATANTIANSPNPDSFHDAAGRSRYADTPALSGSQSGSVLATKDETGFGVWGGAFDTPNLTEGDEVWYRVNVYYPTGWDFSCKGCNQGMKFMRIATQSATGNGEGYIDSYIKGGSTGGTITADSEVDNGFYSTGKTNADIFGLGTPITRDQWHTFEMYVKFSSVQGQAIYRIWQDGNLIFEDLSAGTLFSPSSKANKALLYTYWNEGAPRTQTSYVDDIVITNEVPGRKDANGNPFIGVGASIYIAPPKAPPTANKFERK